MVRALASHARGRRFESYCLYQKPPQGETDESEHFRFVFLYKSAKAAADFSGGRTGDVRETFERRTGKENIRWGV